MKPCCNNKTEYPGKVTLACLDYNSDELIAALKEKTINEFFQLLCSVQKGYRLDYEFILQEIMLLNLTNEMDVEDLLFYLEYYYTNNWTSKLKDTWLIF